MDGAALIHKVRWEKDVTFQEFCEQNVNFVRCKFGQCTVVYDGYEVGPSKKDHKHCRWSVKKSDTVEFTFNEETKVKANQQAFFSNEKNKGRFKKMLSKCKELQRRCLYRNCYLCYLLCRTSHYGC